MFESTVPGRMAVPAAVAVGAGFGLEDTITVAGAAAKTNAFPVYW